MDLIAIKSDVIVNEAVVGIDFICLKEYAKTRNYRLCSTIQQSGNCIPKTRL